MDEKTKGQGTLKKGIFFSAATCLVIFILWAGLMPKTAYKVLTGITNAMYPKETWSSDWWLQYVGSFIVYGPVIGVFLAKIAYGRTIRQFILVNVLVSGGFCAIWCGVFGSMAVYLQSTGIFDVWAAVQEFGMQSTVYQLLSSLPGGKILIVPFIITVCTSFCTIADPASSALATPILYEEWLLNVKTKGIALLLKRVGISA